MPDQERDYYSLLGVGRGASAVEIERAYRRAARATHPDIHPDDSSAAERFNSVTVAYETLRSPERRASYDRAHTPIRPVAGRRPPARGAAPIHLGRRRPPPEPLEPLGFRPVITVVEPGAGDLFDVFAALSRMMSSRPFR